MRRTSCGRSRVYPLALQQCAQVPQEDPHGVVLLDIAACRLASRMATSVVGKAVRDLVGEGGEGRLIQAGARSDSGATDAPPGLRLAGERA